MENSAYSKIKEDFNKEAVKEDSIFKKSLTECDILSIEYLKGYAQPYYKILEIGCGKGNVIEALEGEKYGLDISEEMLKECTIENKVVGNMDELPYEDDMFDLVYMIMTFQQSKNREKTLKEMERVAKGWVIIIDGNKDSVIGKFREQEIKAGEWKMVGEAKWLSKNDFKDWESIDLAPHILALKKRIDKFRMADDEIEIIIDYIK